jgi:hypothetical protein
MVRRVLVPAAVLLLALLVVPACSSDSKTNGTGAATPATEKGVQPGAGRAG